VAADTAPGLANPRQRVTPVTQIPLPSRGSRPGAPFPARARACGLLDAYPTSDGRWIWDNAFRPTSAVSTMDAFSVDGKHVDLIHTLSSSRSDYSILDKTTTTTTAPKPVVVVGDSMEIRYPDCLSGRHLESAKKLMTQCPAVDRQAVLDEFAAMLRGRVVRHPVGLLNRLVERAKAGEFVPNRSLAELATKSTSNGSLTTTAVNGSASSSSQGANCLYLGDKDPA